MKVLVATKDGQGKRTGDFSYTDEGELVGFAFVCDSDRGQPDGGCGCARAMVGFASRKATTTFKVVERDLTQRELEAKWKASMKAGGWTVKDAEMRQIIADDAAELVRIAGRFEVGTVLEKRGDTIQVRG